MGTYNSTPADDRSLADAGHSDVSSSADMAGSTATHHANQMTPSDVAPLTENTAGHTSSEHTEPVVRYRPDIFTSPSTLPTDASQLGVADATQDDSSVPSDQQTCTPATQQPRLQASVLDWRMFAGDMRKLDLSSLNARSADDCRFHVSLR